MYYKKLLKNYYIYLLLFAITIVGALLRFYNINWDERYFFHPDERNVAIAVLNINYEGCEVIIIDNGVDSKEKAKECDLNPDFFAYGGLPIYTARFFTDDDFDNVLNVLRIQSAVLSTLLIPLIFYLTKLIIKGRNADHIALLSALFLSINVGMIQFAHFGTFEIFLTFQYIIYIIASIKYFQTTNKFFYYTALVFIGFSIATKVVSLALLPIIFLVDLFVIYKRNRQSISKFIFNTKFRVKLFHISVYLIRVLISVLIIFLVFFITSPYYILDYTNLKNSMAYETPVATGELSVFYTQQFIGTTPVIYQLTRIFPYILGIPLTIMSLFWIFIFLVNFFNRLIRRKITETEVSYFIFFLGFVAYSAFHFSVFVKWTRYMVPLMPFMIIFAVSLLNTFLIFEKKLFAKVFIGIIFGTMLIWNMFDTTNFYQRYLIRDPRLEFADWVNKNIPKDAKISTEAYDVGIIPTNDVHGQNNEINFYDFEYENLHVQKQYEEFLRSDYFVIMSNRIYYTRLNNPDKYPLASEFYRKMNNGELGYEQIKYFSRTYYPSGFIDIEQKATEKYIPDETFNVFDNAEVIVYKKIRK